MDCEKYKRGGSFCIFNYPIVRDKVFYQNVKFLFPNTEINKFHSELGILEENNAIIANSNSYIDDPHTNNDTYEYKYGIYSRINYTYATLCESLVQECIGETVCSFMTPFDSSNIGHNLSIVFDFTHQYRKLNLSIPIVLSNISKRFPNVLRILSIFFKDVRFIENDVVYSFKSIYFFTPVITDISRHSDIIQEIRDHVLKNIPIEPYQKKKIFLVKLTEHSNIINPHTAFSAERILDRVRNDNEWVVIQPEKMDIFDIIAYLMDAKTIVTSEGAISYAHSIFFSENARVLYIIRTIGQLIPYTGRRLTTFIALEKNLDKYIDTLLNID